MFHSCCPHAFAGEGGLLTTKTYRENLMVSWARCIRNHMTAKGFVFPRRCVTIEGLASPGVARRGAAPHQGRAS